MFRLRARADVQRRVGAGESSFGGRVQTSAERGLRYICEYDEEATADAAEDGYRHGPLDRHVKAHVAAGRFEDYGGDEEGRRFRCAVARQLHRSYPGAGKLGALRRPVQPDKTVDSLSKMGEFADGGVLPARRPRAGAKYGHQSNVRSAQCHYREVAGRLHRLHRTSTLGDLGRSSTSGCAGYSGHSGGESRLVPVDDTAIAAVR